MKKIALSGKHGKGRFSLVDDEDFEVLGKYRWFIDKDGYAIGHLGKRGQTLRLHRLIMDAPKGMEVDHINTNRLDNQRKNLRICEPHYNRCKKINGIKGIRKIRNRWFARVMYLKKEYALGGYATKLEAALAYNKKAKELFGEFAQLNKVYA